MKLANLASEARLTFGSMADFATGWADPVLRLGVTGLSRAGKTVFITALVHNLIHNTALPMFNAQARGRIRRAYLEPQPDDELPRFAYEDHIEALTGPDRHWPESTSRLSQLRLTIEYEPESLAARATHGGRLHIDIIDYPGEWLLDLPLMQQSYEAWSAATLAASGREPRRTLAKDWRAHMATLDPEASADEAAARKAARLFRDYLKAGRDDAHALSTLPPGRFLMPGDLDGSPLLTFSPLNVEADGDAPEGSLWAMMQRRYNAYVARVVQPFFYNHFARLDRQIVLVDALGALNAGPAAVKDLQLALEGVLTCFRLGARGWFSSVFSRKIDRVVFAATKADLLHHSSHGRLEDIMQLLVDEAAGRAEIAGTRIDVAALAAIRATREAIVKSGGEDLACIAGIPKAGEMIGGETFDGKTEAAIFTGDLPDKPEQALMTDLQDTLRFVRFRPPLPKGNNEPGQPPVFGHIRLDKTIEFLLGGAFA